MLGNNSYDTPHMLNDILRLENQRANHKFENSSTYEGLSTPKILSL